MEGVYVAGVALLNLAAIMFLFNMTPKRKTPVQTLIDIHPKVPQDASPEVQKVLSSLITLLEDKERESLQKLLKEASSKNPKDEVDKLAERVEKLEKEKTEAEKKLKEAETAASSEEAAKKKAEEEAKAKVLQETLNRINGILLSLSKGQKLSDESFTSIIAEIKKLNEATIDNLSKKIIEIENKLKQVNGQAAAEAAPAPAGATPPAQAPGAPQAPGPGAPGASGGGKRHKKHKHDKKYSKRSSQKNKHDH